MKPLNRDHSFTDTGYCAVALGGSAGGTDAMLAILAGLPADFPLPVLVVEHLHPQDDGSLAERLARNTPLRVITPCDKEPIKAGCVYVAPANYHMLVEREFTIALSVDERVRWSRPSIDVLFESAAYAWGPRLIAIILSGANDDGTQGLLAVKRNGGLTIAQSPESALYPVMPEAAIAAGAVGKTLDPLRIQSLLIELSSISAGPTESGENGEWNMLSKSDTPPYGRSARLEKSDENE